MNRQTGLLRQHEMRATQQVATQRSTQSLAKVQEYSSTPPRQSQRSAQETNMFITRILDECGLEIKMADEENMNNNDELNVSFDSAEILESNKMAVKSNIEINMC